MKNQCKTISHVLSVTNDQELHIWETPPNESVPPKNSAILIASGLAKRMDHFAGLAEYLSENGFYIPYSIKVESIIVIKVSDNIAVGDFGCRKS